MKILSPLKVVTVVGTRPEIIRLSRVITALDSSSAIDHILIHTGQNYDYTLNEIFFEELGIRKPDYFLDSVVEGSSASSTIGNLISLTLLALISIGAGQDRPMFFDYLGKAR